MRGVKLHEQEYWEAVRETLPPDLLPENIRTNEQLVKFLFHGLDLSLQQPRNQTIVERIKRLV